MAKQKKRPLLNPVLRFTKEPRPEAVAGGGKSSGGIKTERLESQRRALSSHLELMASQVRKRPGFGGKAVIYASMFDDSLAPTWTPSDLFQGDRGARLVTPYSQGYLVEISANLISALARLIRDTGQVRDLVDISRVEAIRFFEDKDALGSMSIDQLWSIAPKVKDGRAFVIWLMPLQDHDGVEGLLQQFISLRESVITPPPSLLESIIESLDGSVPADMRRSIRSIAGTRDHLSLAMRTYRQRRHSRTTVVVQSSSALGQLVASGAVFRIEPVPEIFATSPGEGREPDRPLPTDMSSRPIVGIIDGGLSAGSYRSAEVWRAPPLVQNSVADHKHGNLVTSLVVQGHDWNNNLSLAELYCQFGTVQAVAKKEAKVFIDPQDFIAYLDAVIAANPATKVWNFSLNQNEPCNKEAVSALGHDIASLARKHGILPIISIGNKPGDDPQPPADCEAALTVGGRAHDKHGMPAGACSISLSGPGPCGMLKPDISHFSNVRALGGTLVKGSSFSTALTSPIAAHTMSRLRDASPDMVRALLLHGSDADGFSPSTGFGTPRVDVLPWECRPGFVTLQWKASLRPGAAYYWDIPIPQSLRKSGKLKGSGTLTAILNPHPMISEVAGPNYFSVRLNTAVQYQHNGETKNLLGSLDTDKIKEKTARAIEHKWSPVRHHANSFRGRGFDGDELRVHARVYARDLYLYGYSGSDQIPELDTVFVLSIGTGEEADDIYNELRDQLGAFVEAATIETDIEIDGESS